MSNVVIFANGEISAPIQVPASSLVIAADGGARHCLALGIWPQVVIGDFDSLTPAQSEALAAAHAELIRRPSEKDETDLELALDLAVQRGAGDITLYGLLGGRWDMSAANLLLLASPRFAGVRLRLVADRMEAFILRGGETLPLRGRPGDTVSVLPLSNAAWGVTYHGLRWPLENACLSFGSPRGVSNVLQNDSGQIALREGVLLVFHSW